MMMCLGYKFGQQFYQMNHIELFQKEKQEKSINRLNQMRPDKLSVSKVMSDNEKWTECKVLGKNISIRSYSSACVFDNKMWVYGGYQILNGLMADFYYINLDHNQEIFNWVEVMPKQNNLPGPRAKHALLSTKQHIYLVGGLYSDVLSSNQILRFTPQHNKWDLLTPVGEILPALDSFACTIAEREGDQVIIIACGYNGQKAKYSNTVYEYSITKNKISTLFQGGEDHLNTKYPIARSGCAMAGSGNIIYLFGGKNDQHRMNDLWQFRLNELKFSKMPEEGVIPSVRNGHSLNIYGGKLYLFGGIHDITWQLDDLHIYCLKKKEWTTLEQDSARKVQKKKKNEEKKQKKQEKSPGKNWYETANQLYGNKSNINSPLMKNSTNYKEDDHNKSTSPGKMIEEQRKKLFYQKKADMLKQFDVNQLEKGRYIEMETSAQAMKNSLDAIGNPNPKAKIQEGKLTDFGKESTSKFLQPLKNNKNIIVGKRPCARDGHCSVLLLDSIVIFGGDRHQMSFNDIYKMNIQLANQSTKI